MNGLAELAERCERAAGPDLELDREIAIFVGWRFRFDQHDDDLSDETWIDPDGREHLDFPRFTGSIDAATNLFPKGAMYRSEGAMYLSGHDGAGHGPSMFFCEAITDAPECGLLRLLNRMRGQQPPSYLAQKGPTHERLGQR